MQRTLLACALLLAAACGDASAPPAVVTASGSPATKKLVVGFSQFGAESSWHSAEIASIKIEARKRGIDLRGSDAQQKPELQIQALHDFIAQGVDAVLIAPQEEQGFEPVLRELVAAKIPVILLDRGLDCDPSLYATLIASDFVAEGRLAARWLADHTTGTVRVIELEGAAGSARAIDRKKGFHDEVSKTARITVVHRQGGQPNLLASKAVMEAVLRSETEPFQAVYAHDDDLALGAIQALEAAGKRLGTDVLVLSIGATRAAFDAILAGKLAVAVECSPLLGPLAFDTLQKITSGATIPKRIVVEDRVFDASNAAAELPNRRY